MVADDSGLYVTGSVRHTSDHVAETLGQPLPGSADLPAAGAFVARLTFDGSESWMTFFADSQDGVGSGIDVRAGIVSVVGGHDGHMFAAELTAGPSCVGTSSPDADEAGPVSGPVHSAVEPLAGPGAPVVHDLNCAVIAQAGL
jgi:hypothetical protein